MLTDKDPATGEYRIPHIIYSDAYFSEMVAYADLVLPDTTYLERWDCISLLDRPICDADGAADAIRQPVVAPDRDVRPFQDVLIDLGARLGLPGLDRATTAARAIPAAMPTTSSTTSAARRRPAGRLARRGRRARPARARPTRTSSSATSPTAASGATSCPPSARYFKHANRAYLEWAVGDGLDRPAPSRSCCSSTASRCRSSASPREGHGAVQPPEQHRERVATYFDPLPIWYPPFEEAADRRATLPAARDHPAADGDVPLLGLAERLAAADPRQQPPLPQPRDRGAALGLADDDWVWVTSHHGRIKVQVRLMDGVNPDTVWTWNAIGKRTGAWNLAADAPEARKGFLLNHLISELLPRARGRLSLRQRRSGHRPGGLVRPARAHREGGRGRGRHQRAAVRGAARRRRACPSARRAALRRRVPRRRRRRRMTSLPAAPSPQAARPGHRPRHLRRLPRLRGQLQGMEHRRPHGAADRSRRPTAPTPRGVWFNRVHSFEVGEGADGRTVHFPRSCLHCEEPACVTVCPTGASYKRAEDGIVLVNEELCIGCKLCSWACPYGAREFDADDGVMKKCTLCIDRIYNENLERGRPRAGLRRAPARPAPAISAISAIPTRRSRGWSPSAAATT